MSISEQDMARVAELARIRLDDVTVADVTRRIRDILAMIDQMQAVNTDHVPVDFELRGCPITKQQLLEVLSSFLAGRRPQTPAHSVCVECKVAGNTCVTVVEYGLIVALIALAAIITAIALGWI